MRHKKKPSQWTTLSRRTVYACRPYVVVERHAVRLPDGRVIRGWTWLDMPDFVNIVARTRGGKFLCFRQTKYALKGLSLGPPGGYVEPGERPLAAAKRELLEETGYAAREWHSLGSYVVDSNRGAGSAHFFLALEAVKTGARTADDLEEQELLLLSRRQVEQALAKGRVLPLTWMTVLVLALRKLDELEG